jgi:hypothetical protein
MVAASSLGAIGRGAVDAGARGVTSDAMASSVDQLLRSTRSTPAGTDTRDVRAEMARLLTGAVAQGEFPAADRTYMAELVAARTGVDQAEAERRVTQTINAAKSATDKARKAAVVLGFLIAASMLVAAAAAWWGATVGGRDRDAGSLWHGFSRYSSSTRSGKV